MTQPDLMSLEDIQPREGTIRVIPLGGLGEIGMNCCLFESGGEYVMLDCGQTMPDDETLGVDSIIPDLSLIEDEPERLKAILITHAHEDHVGALPHVLPRFPNVPIYGSELTLALLREKLREYRLAPKLRQLTPREPVKISDRFEVEPLAVTHSIIDALGVAIRTPAGIVIHTGDFKMDPTPPDGVAFDQYAFARYAEEEEGGVLLLMSDSTNVDRSGSCPSEREVIPGLDTLIREAESTIILSTFASSLHRIQNVLNLAAKNGRSVVAFGLNMERNIRIASEIGALEIPCDYHSDPKAVRRIPREKLLVLCTGSQGEPMSALSRLSSNSHREMAIEPGDTVIMSARMIPGNEAAIYRMVNQLARRGAKVITEGMARIHVSGHAYRDDMRHMINLTNPRFFVPVHGEFRHLDAHCRLAVEQGLEEEETFLLENGDCLELTEDSAEVIGKVPHGRVFVDGKGIGDVDEFILRDRRYLSQDGMVVVIMNVDHEDGEILAGPEIVARGFSLGEDPDSVVERLCEAVVTAYEEMSPQMRQTSTEVQATIKKTVRRFFKKESGRFPIIMPVVMEL